MNAKQLGEQTVAPETATLGERSVSKGGLTKREYFAGLALCGALPTAAAPLLTGMQCAERSVAEQAARMADAMLAELAKAADAADMRSIYSYVTAIGNELRATGCSLEIRAAILIDELVTALNAWQNFSGCCLHESTVNAPAFTEARRLTNAVLVRVP